MKTQNAKWMKWVRRTSSLMLILAMTLGIAGQASARILFEDDAYFGVESEGIVLDENNNAGTDTIELQFGNDGTDATMTYDPTTQDITIDTPGNDVDFSDDTLTTTGEIRFENASHVRIREAAFAAYTGVTAPDCDYVGEIALDTNTDAIFVCTATGAPGGTWVSADNNPANGASDSQTLRWDASTSTWEANSNLLVDDAASSVTVANGTSLTANGSVTIGDGGDAFDINATTANWDLTSIDLDTTGAININSASGAGNDITIGAGDQLFFDDNTLTTNVALNVNETALSGNYSANGIIDALNDLQSTTEGAEGATFVATDASDFTNVTVAGNTVQDALEALDAGIGTATQNFDDVYDESVSDGNLTMEIDNGTLNYNVTGTDSFAVQDGGANVAEFTGAGAVLFDPTTGQNFDVDTLGAGDILLDSADTVSIDGDGAVTVGGAGISLTSDGGDLDLTGDSTNDIDITNVGAAIDVDSASVTIDTTGAFSLDGAAASNISTTGADLTLSTITSGDLNVTSVGDLTFTDQYDSLTFAQVSAGMGNDLLNAGGEIYSNTGTIGATIGTGETSTSLVHAINAIGTYAVGIGAGANDDIDDVYNNGGTGTYFANVDTVDTGYNITSTDGDGFSVQDTGTNFADFSVDASGNSIIDFDPYDFTLDATNAFSIQGVANSDITTTTGDITLTAGDDVIFDDAQLTGVVQLSDTATDWNGTFSSDGIIDNINSFTSTAAGEGASNVGIQDASNWYTGTETETALNELESLLGSTTSATYNFAEDNVLADNDSVYPALNKLDQKWGDLSSNANGEGASLVGIEDAGTYFTATDVEGALQELAADAAVEVEDLTFYPEYPDAVAYADGTANRGTLSSEYDDSQDTNHYNWTTRRSAQQDINVQFMFVLPPDFDAIGTNGLQFEYRTGTATTTDNKVDLYMYERTGAGATTLCGSDLTNANGTGVGGAFATGQITKATIDGACTLTAGDVILIEAKLFDNSGAADFADVGYVTLDYTR